MAESEDSGEENFYGIYAGSPLRWRPMLKSPVTVEVLLDEGDVCMLLNYFVRLYETCIFQYGRVSEKCKIS